jgi:hypothetical protein
MDKKRFPKALYRENPFAPRIPDSIIIPYGYSLPDPMSDKEALYFDYFKNIDNYLENISEDVSSEYFSRWLKSLKDVPKSLMIHDIEQYDPNGTYSNFYIGFDNKYELELISNEYLIRILNLPKPLQDVFKFGKIWVRGVPLQRYFCHPKEVIKINKEEDLIDFINCPENGIRELGFPIDELKTFYVDSGCWLMYDKKEVVYCGGYECGDFYRTSQNLEETVNLIFKGFIEYSEDPKFGFNPDIESFVKKEHNTK